MITTDKLNFLTAGMPLSTGKGGYPRAFEILGELDLDGMEVEFVHGVRMSDETRQLLKKISEEKGFILTSHGPFYINLNSKEEEKVEASV
jgi:deoxyribonuclease-4